MSEKDPPRQSSRRWPGDNVFEWFVEEWRKRYAATEAAPFDPETIGHQVLSFVCEKNCLDPEEVKRLNEEAHLVVRVEAGLDPLAALQQGSQSASTS